MKTIEIQLYKFEELSKEAKEKALNLQYNINIDHDWWQFTYEDAKQVYLKLTEFDLDRANYCKGEFIYSAIDTANEIIKNHGENTDTYLTAKDYLKDRDNLVYQLSDKVNTEIVSEENEYEFDSLEDELNEDFLKSILEDYRILLYNEYDYLTSEEAIIETIEVNEYNFTEFGEIY